jgi:hypothetical protein
MVLGLPPTSQSGHCEMATKIARLMISVMSKAYPPRPRRGSVRRGAGLRRRVGRHPGRRRRQLLPVAAVQLPLEHHRVQREGAAPGHLGVRNRPGLGRTRSLPRRIRGQLRVRGAVGHLLHADPRRGPVRPGGARRRRRRYDHGGHADGP